MAEATMNETLREIRGRVDRITGLLVATRDGLVLCSATHGIEDRKPNITMGLSTLAARQALSLLQQALLRGRVPPVRNARGAHVERQAPADAEHTEDGSPSLVREE
jgi:hypothetical protein